MQVVFDPEIDLHIPPKIVKVLSKIKQGKSKKEHCRFKSLFPYKHECMGIGVSTCMHTSAN